MRKKAISPLIATVLLIGFAVALAAVVMTWGGGFIRSTTESTETQAETTLMCATKLNFDVKLVCPNKITIDNKGSIGMKGVLIRLHKASGDIEASESDDTTVIGPYEVKTLGTSFTGDTNKVEVIAILEDGTTCGDSPRESTVPNCGTAT